ncbi:TIM44-like domain-containing protein [Aquabacter sp. L1I39]|nr:TIM44-like domain-containing protein [Aquabacter sp. L1I39]
MLAGIVALGSAMSLATLDTADARKGGGFGSRGTRTYQAPPSTQTAPTTAQPIQRSVTQPSAATGTAAAATRGGLFGGGFAGSLLRGLAIGGLVGLLLGHGLGGMAGFLGLLLQAALIGIVAMLVFRFLAARRQPAPAGAPASMAREGVEQPRSALGGLGGMGGLGGGQTRPQQAPAQRGVKDAVGLTGADFDSFERILGEVQGAFSREDYGALRTLTTLEVYGYLTEELRDNEARGVRNQVSEVKLLQGDLAEAWREGTTDYATVAMRYSMRDRMVDRATGQSAPGSVDDVTETTEVWTFTRTRGGAWTLSAIQDA